MPELPEVQTTVSGLQKVLPKLVIKDVWSDLPVKKVSLAHFEETLKSSSFFRVFREKTIGARILSVERRAKNILINLSTGTTILIHMKMTGHFLYGKYVHDKKTNAWHATDPGPLQDSFNRFLHVVFVLSNGKHLVLSDMRKFAKVTLVTTKEAHSSKHLAGLGPEPLEKTFTFKKFFEQISLRPTGRIKNVLMDQTLISGIGNIYSDEALWLASIHPEERVANISKEQAQKLYKSITAVLKKGIDFRGDSTSDYRNIDGRPGKFSHHHNTYRRTGKPCGKPGCKGVILRKVVGGRSAHFCSIHQKLRY